MARRRLYYEKTETITRKIKGFVEVDMEYAQYYRGLVRANSMLSMQCSFKLLPFLFFELNDSNVFAFDTALVDKFNSVCSPDKPYKFRTVRAAIKEMLDADIIRKIGNSRYYIKPEYCWIGSGTDRREMIVAQQLSVDGLLNSPEDAQEE